MFSTRHRLGAVSVSFSYLCVSNAPLPNLINALTTIRTRINYINEETKVTRHLNTVRIIFILQHDLVR